MAEPSVIVRQRELLRQPRDLVADRAALELSLLGMRDEQRAHAEAQARQARESVSQRTAAEHEAADRELRATREKTEAAFAAERTAAETEYRGARAAILKCYRVDRDAALTAWKEARWTQAAVLESAKESAEKKLRESQAELKADQQRIAAIRDEARAQLTCWKQPGSYCMCPMPPSPSRGSRSRTSNYAAAPGGFAGATSEADPARAARTAVRCHRARPPWSSSAGSPPAFNTSTAL